MYITVTKKLNKIVEDGQIDVTTEKTVALVFYLFSIGKKIRGKGELPAAVHDGNGVSRAFLNLWLIHLTMSYVFSR